MLIIGTNKKRLHSAIVKEIDNSEVKMTQMMQKWFMNYACTVNVKQKLINFLNSQCE